MDGRNAAIADFPWHGPRLVRSVRISHTLFVSSHMRLAIFIIFIALAISVNAQTEKAFSKSEDLGNWITYYYKSPDSTRVAQAVLFASQNGFFKDGKASPPFFGFLAGWFSQNRSSAEALVEQLVELPAADQPVLVLGLWYSAIPESKALLTKYASRLPSQEALIAQLAASGQPSILEIPIEQGPWVLDALWGNFMATGSEAPVARIVSALPWATIKGDIPRLLVGGSAKWSLTSNAVQHPRVLEICRQLLPRSAKEVVAPLKTVIRDAEQDLRKERNGD